MIATTQLHMALPRSFRDFHFAYVECALWSSADDDGDPLDSLGLILSDTAGAKILADCADFFNAHRDTYTAAGMSDDQAGHDFWLTRNRHGAGFWDRGLGDVGETLTAAAHACGECDLFVGDTGEIEVTV